jgi:hypothetical protein
MLDWMEWQRSSLTEVASNDPDGDALAFSWAWATGSNAYLSNGVSLFMRATCWPAQSATDGEVMGISILSLLK